MKGSFYSKVFTVAITIFAMYFGAGNLIFPLRIGMDSGQHTLLGFLGFSLSGIVLPMIALMAIIAFEGSYNNFFGRLGNYVGKFFILICMMVIGPFIAMPRIITLSYVMTKPFMPEVSTMVFGLMLSAIVFIVAYRPGKLLDIIGKFLGPIKIVMIALIIIAGIFTGYSPRPTILSKWDVFSSAFTYGYVTLDILASIFFGSIIFTLLTKYSVGKEKTSMKEAIKITAYAGFFGGLLLAVVYFGMTYLGAYHGYGLTNLNEAQVFSHISLRVLGYWGAFFMAATVCIACFVTLITLSSVVGEYLQMLVGKRLSYAKAVSVVLLMSSFVASFGFEVIMEYSIPFIFIFYPLIITTVFCNLLYKKWNFEFIKIPVLFTGILIIVLKIIW